MNRSLEVLKDIYKPYRYTIKGNVTLLETTSGDFIIKPKTKDIPELYQYLLSRNFDNFPSIIDASRSDVYVYQRVVDTKMAIEQKCDDLIDLISSLHNKTSYYKEVSEDSYKAIYEDIHSNILYLRNYYSAMYDSFFKEIYMRPSSYLFMRNFSKLMNSLDFCERELDSWYELIQGEAKIRVAVVHNNLEFDHFIKGEKDFLISWDQYKIDTPIIDIVGLYRKEYLHINFEKGLERYMSLYPLLPHEEKLLFILLAMPFKIEEEKKELEQCREIRKKFDYVFKTEDLLRPYYATKEE